MGRVAEGRSYGKRFYERYLKELSVCMLWYNRIYKSSDKIGALQAYREWERRWRDKVPEAV